MKHLLCLVACFFFASTSIADASSIRVTGVGSTIEKAKENAFREAIQIQVGTVVLSERESTLQAIEKDDISVYSAGYIDKYKIISSNSIGDQVVIEVDVWVSSSKIANRMLGAGKVAKTVDGDRLSTQYNSYLKNRADGDIILAKVLDDYPRSAFTLTQEPYQFQLDTRRNAVLIVPYEIKWNYNYIVALNEALDMMQEGSNGFLKTSPGNIVVMAKDPKDWVLGKKNHYKFNDMFRPAQVKNAVIGNKELRLRLAVFDANNKLALEGCWVPGAVSGKQSAFYSIGDPSMLVIYGNITEKNSIQIVVEPNSALNSLLKDIVRLELSAVPASKC
jgi:hypothetical protein